MGKQRKKKNKKKENFSKYYLTLKLSEVMSVSGGAHRT